jgi:hypothetical protein
MTRRYGVGLKPRLVDAEGRRVRFDDGSELEVDAVIWSTGYSPDYSWIKLPIFGEDGRLRCLRFPAKGFGSEVMFDSLDARARDGRI